MTTIEAPPRTTVTVADLFKRAADILEEFDWRQGRAGCRKEGSMCAIGAIYEACFDYGLALRDPTSVAAFFGHGAPRECGIFPLAVWNDDPDRTKAEVVAELRRLAEVSA